MLWPSCSYNLSQHCFGTCCTGKGILPSPAPSSPNVFLEERKIELCLHMKPPEVKRDNRCFSSSLRFETDSERSPAEIAAICHPALARGPGTSGNAQKAWPAHTAERFPKQPSCQLGFGLPAPAGALAQGLEEALGRGRRPRVSLVIHPPGARGEPGGEQILRRR